MGKKATQTNVTRYKKNSNTLISGSKFAGFCVVWIRLLRFQKVVPFEFFFAINEKEKAHILRKRRQFFSIALATSDIVIINKFWYKRIRQAALAILFWLIRRGLSTDSGICSICESALGG